MQQIDAFALRFAPQEIDGWYQKQPPDGGHRRRDESGKRSISRRFRGPTA